MKIEFISSLNDFDAIRILQLPNKKKKVHPFFEFNWLLSTHNRKK